GEYDNARFLLTPVVSSARARRLLRTTSERLDDASTHARFATRSRCPPTCGSAATSFLPSVGTEGHADLSYRCDSHTATKGETPGSVSGRCWFCLKGLKN